MTRPRRIAVVGAGMAGMAAAYELARTPGVTFTLFEATARLGGTVETVTLPSASGEPFVIETGPDSWVTEKTAARDLAVELGLGAELISSNDATRRTYLAQPGHGSRGELVPLPDGMRMMVPTRWAPLLESPLFSWQARLAYLREPKRAAELRAHALAQPEDADESVGDFTRRHFGDEATRTVAGPLLAGVFGGDIETLSAAAVLGPFKAMEREHGSLITALARRVGSQPAAPIFTTLRGGLGSLVHGIAAALPAESIRLGCRVTALRPEAEGGGWRLQMEASAGGWEHFDAVLLATPADVTQTLLRPLDEQAAALLACEASSAIVVALAWEPAAAAHLRIPQGFGFLLPPAQGLAAEQSLLACTFMHQKFAHRAPRGAVFLRGFFGGEAALRLQDEPDEAIAAIALRECSRYLGPLPAPAHTVVRRWPRSLPQYAVGHLARMRVLAGRVAGFAGLGLVGNAYQGVGLPNLVACGREEARRLGKA